MLNLYCDTILASAEVAEHIEEVGGVFSGTLGDSLWTIIWFVLLLLVLKKFAWKHILAGLQSREDYIRKQVTDAEDDRKKAKQVLDEYNQKILDSHEQGESIARKHLDKAQVQAVDIVQKAQQETEYVKDQANSEIERAKIRAKDEIAEQASGLVLSLGKEILGRAVEPEDNQKLIDDVIAEFKARSKNE